MALSGQQRTRISGHGAGMAYSGFVAKVVAGLKLIPRAVYVLSRAITTFILRRDIDVAVQEREATVHETHSDRSIIIQRGDGK